MNSDSERTNGHLPEKNSGECAEKACENADDRDFVRILANEFDEHLIRRWRIVQRACREVAIPQSIGAMQIRGVNIVWHSQRGSGAGPTRRIELVNQDIDIGGGSLSRDVSRRWQKAYDFEIGIQKSQRHGECRVDSGVGDKYDFFCHDRILPQLGVGRPLILCLKSDNLAGRFGIIKHLMAMPAECIDNRKLRKFSLDRQCEKPPGIAGTEITILIRRARSNLFSLPDIPRTPA